MASTSTASYPVELERATDEPPERDRPRVGRPRSRTGAANPRRGKLAAVSAFLQLDIKYCRPTWMMSAETSVPSASSVLMWR